MKFCRLKALIEELLIDWDELNLAAKLLVYIGLLIMIATIFIAFYEINDVEVFSRIEVTFRTSLAAVFGFLLSSNINNKYKNSNSNSNRNNDRKKQIINVDKDKDTTDDCKEKKEKFKYYYGEGNTVQMLIALGMTIICATVILFVYVYGDINDMSILSQFRDIMCSSIGFLLGEAKIKPRD